MIAQIQMPQIFQESGFFVPVQKDPVGEAASQSWLAGAFVYTSGTGASVVLNMVPVNGTVIYGQSPDAAIGSGSPPVMLKPPQSLFGLMHYPFDPRDRIFAVNLHAGGTGGTANDAVIGTVNGATWAGGGTGGVALAPGQQYGICVPASGAYVKYQLLDVSNTTNKVFEIVALAPGFATSDANPRVLVKVIPTVLQG